MLTSGDTDTAQTSQPQMYKRKRTSCTAENNHSKREQLKKKKNILIHNTALKNVESPQRIQCP